MHLLRGGGKTTVAVFLFGKAKASNNSVVQIMSIPVVQRNLPKQPGKHYLVRTMPLCVRTVQHGFTLHCTYFLFVSTLFVSSKVKAVNSYTYL